MNYLRKHFKVLSCDKDDQRDGDERKKRAWYSLVGSLEKRYLREKYLWRPRAKEPVAYGTAPESASNIQIIGSVDATKLDAGGSILPLFEEAIRADGDESPLKDTQLPDKVSSNREHSRVHKNTDKSFFFPFLFYFFIF